MYINVLDMYLHITSTHMIIQRKRMSIPCCFSFLDDSGEASAELKEFISVHVHMYIILSRLQCTDCLLILNATITSAHYYVSPAI